MCSWTTTTGIDRIERCRLGNDVVPLPVDLDAEEAIPDVLVVVHAKMQLFVERALAADRVREECATYYVTDYYRAYPLVLVRLSSVDRDALSDLLWTSWRLTAAKVRKHLPSRRRGG